MFDEICCNMSDKIWLKIWYNMLDKIWCDILDEIWCKMSNEIWCNIDRLIDLRSILQPRWDMA